MKAFEDFKNEILNRFEAGNFEIRNFEIENSIKWFRHDLIFDNIIIKASISTDYSSIIFYHAQLLLDNFSNIEKEFIYNAIKNAIHPLLEVAKKKRIEALQLELMKELENELQ